MNRSKIIPLIVATGLLFPFLSILHEGTAQGSTEPFTGAVVSLGDSYMSGEGGRWAGNSDDNAPPARPAGPGDYSGTDRAAQDHGRSVDKTKVYPHDYGDPWNIGEENITGCHRSDVAEVHSAFSGTRFKTINLACSGAVTANVKRKVDGGIPQTPAQPAPESKKNKLKYTQADALRMVAEKEDVRFILLSIGGNDLNFSDIIKECVGSYLYKSGIIQTFTGQKSPCHKTQQRAYKQKLQEAMSNVSQTVASIQAAMAEVKLPNGRPKYGYSPSYGQYRIMLQSAPSPLPDSSRIRGAQAEYAGKDPQTETYSRWKPYGCPFFNSDMDWAQSTLGPDINDNLRSVADSTGIDFMDLTDAFEGHELCSEGTRLYTTQNPRKADDRGEKAEWMRYVDVYFPTLRSAGDTEESVHPNYYGQLALGVCVQKAWEKLASEWPDGSETYWYQGLDHKCTPKGDDATPKAMDVKVSPRDKSRYSVRPPTDEILLTSTHGKCLQKDGNALTCPGYGSWEDQYVWTYEDGRLRNLVSKVCLQVASFVQQCQEDIGVTNRFKLREDRKVEVIPHPSLRFPSTDSRHRCLISDGNGADCDEISREDWVLWSSVIEMRTVSGLCLYGKFWDSVNPAVFPCPDSGSFVYRGYPVVWAWAPVSGQKGEGSISDTIFTEGAARTCLGKGYAGGGTTHVGVGAEACSKSDGYRLRQDSYIQSGLYDGLGLGYMESDYGYHSLSAMYFYPLNDGAGFYQTHSLKWHRRNKNHENESPQAWQIVNLPMPMRR